MACKRYKSCMLNERTVCCAGPADAASPAHVAQNPAVGSAKQEEQAQSGLGLDAGTPCSLQPYSAPAGQVDADMAADLAPQPGSCEVDIEIAEVQACKDAAVQRCQQEDADRGQRLDGSSAGPKLQSSTKAGGSADYGVHHEIGSDDKRLQPAAGTAGVEAAAAACGDPVGMRCDSSAASSPGSSQLAYADAPSNAVFTPVPLVDRLPKAGNSVSLQQLPSPALLPASCPATPGAQHGSAASGSQEAGTPPFPGRPMSAGVQYAG